MNQLSLNFSIRRHRQHEMHANSMAAFAEERPKLGRRAHAIYELCLNAGRGLTDREIYQRLNLPEPNCVRPRITELKKAGLVTEVGSTTCPVTGKTVRLVGVSGKG